MQVTIYIETSFNGSPAVRRGAGMWLIEFIRKNGDPVTREGVVYGGMTTEIVVTLLCMTEAFLTIKKGCSALVNTTCSHVLNVMWNHYLPIWEKNGWINAKGREVRNKELWQKCKEAMEDKQVMVRFGGPHSYRVYMRDKIGKELRKHGG